MHSRWSRYTTCRRPGSEIPEAAEGCHRANGKPSAPSYIAKPDQPHRSRSGKTRMLRGELHRAAFLFGKDQREKERKLMKDGKGIEKRQEESRRESRKGQGRAEGRHITNKAQRRGKKRSTLHVPTQRIASPIAACCIAHRNALPFPLNNKAGWREAVSRFHLSPMGEDRRGGLRPLTTFCKALFLVYRKRYRTFVPKYA